MYVITTESRKRDELLVMVDRKRQRASFWSNRLDDAFIFDSEQAAKAKADSLRFNNPQVLALTEAQQLFVEDEEYGHILASGLEGHGQY